MDIMPLSHHIAKLEEERNHRKQILQALEGELPSDMTLHPFTFEGMNITKTDLHPDFLANKKRENETRLWEIENMLEDIISILRKQ